MDLKAEVCRVIVSPSLEDLQRLNNDSPMVSFDELGGARPGGFRAPDSLPCNLQRLAEGRDRLLQPAIICENQRGRTGQHFHIPAG